MKKLAMFAVIVSLFLCPGLASACGFVSPVVVAAPVVVAQPVVFAQPVVIASPFVQVQTFVPFVATPVVQTVVVGHGSHSRLFITSGRRLRR